ncbi:MAG: DUF4269 domain-containing protein [Bacteroidales bacterium]|nr:DUF4269 domain-containing protein [Bacteroidales bacterium]
MSKLIAFDPILVGTLPINIDIETSDLDIICHCSDPDQFAGLVSNTFKHHRYFSIKRTTKQHLQTIVARFQADDFEIEIFGQTAPTQQQNAYRHMIIEHKLLLERDEAFRQQIIELKKRGYKTEPAFGIALGLKGNAYEELLRFES